MQELKIAYNTSYNRRKFLLELPYNRLSDEVDAFLTAINNLLAWAESGVGIFDRQKFEYRYDLEWEDSEGNVDSMDIDDNDGNEDSGPTDDGENDNPTAEDQVDNPTDEDRFGDTNDSEHVDAIGSGNDCNKGHSGDINQNNDDRIESDNENRTTGSIIENENARIVSEKRLKGGPKIKFVGAKKDKPYSGGSDHHYRGYDSVRGEPSSSRSNQPSEYPIQISVGSHHPYENPFKDYEDPYQSSGRLYGESQNRDRLDRISQQSIGDILQQRINHKGYRSIRKDTDTVDDNGDLIMSDNSVEYEPSIPSSTHNPSNPIMEKLPLQEIGGSVISGQQSMHNGGSRYKGKQVDRDGNHPSIQELQSSYAGHQDNTSGSRFVAPTQKGSSRLGTTSIIPSASSAPSVDSRQGNKTSGTNDADTSRRDDSGDDNRDINRARAGYGIPHGYPRNPEIGGESTSGSSSRNTTGTISRSTSRTANTSVNGIVKRVPTTAAYIRYKKNYIAI
ncbi:hypothetical protein BJ944DRAFT_260656 [Cunninghamella echinulata]|nr:hypothetical protein BJ944DRAFT_260656 [Cunninghamella echinulata]